MRTIPAALGGAALLCATAAAAIAIAPAPEASSPSVLLITVDTLRPDALGWVAGRVATPHLDELAGEGFRFPGAVSPVPLTLPAHASLLTGLLPRRHGVRENGRVLAAALPTLAVELGRRGYATAAFIGGFPLRSEFGLARGFERYDDDLPVGSDSGGSPRWRERPAAESVARALAWLDGRGETHRPWFLWLHFYEPHDPYDPPAALALDGPRGGYDGEVRAVDQAIGELRRGLRQRGLDRHLLTVFTSDHGESLGEHDEATHGFFVYDSTILVPLVIHWPREIAAGESRAAARLIDVAPTVLELTGAGTLGEIDGQSLAPLLRGRRMSLPPAYVESWTPWLGYGWAPLTAIREADWKLIVAPRPELYELGSDPGEARNRFDSERRVARRLDRTRRAIEAHGGGAANGASPAATAASAELRALGYLSGASGDEAAPAAGLLDPKDRRAMKRALDLAEGAASRGETAAALAAFDLALAEEATNRYALLRAGQLAVELGRTSQAKSRFETLLALAPDHGEARFALADLLARRGERAAAIAAWREVVRRQPWRAVAWSNLGAILAQGGQLAEALAALDRALALEPENATVRENRRVVHERLSTPRR